MMRGHCVFRGLLPNFIPWDFVLEAPFRGISMDFHGADPMEVIQIPQAYALFTSTASSTPGNSPARIGGFR